MIDCIINILGDILDFFLDFWINKIINRKKRKLTESNKALLEGK